MQVSRDKIREIIGPGGKTIRSIQEETGCEVEIEPDGKIIIASPDGTAARRAMEIIEKLTEVPEVGKVYQGVVTRIESFGAFVEILPGTEGLLHVSELAPFRVREVSDILREGDQVEVKALEVDPDGRRIRLSRKAVVLDDPSYDPATDPFAAAAESSEGRPDRGERGPGERGGDRGERGGERGGRGGRGPGGRPPAGRGGRGGGGGGRGRGRPPGRDR
jgi:polyribonucleotide nucleotidyltransferase